VGITCIPYKETCVKVLFLTDLQSIANLFLCKNFTSMYINAPIGSAIVILDEQHNIC